MKNNLYIIIINYSVTEEIWGRWRRRRRSWNLCKSYNQMNSILGKLFHLAKNGISEIQSWDYCYYILWWCDISLYNVYFEKQRNATPLASRHYFIIPSSRGKRGEKKWPGLMNFYKFAMITFVNFFALN